MTMLFTIMSIKAAFGLIFGIENLGSCLGFKLHHPEGVGGQVSQICSY